MYLENILNSMKKSNTSKEEIKSPSINQQAASEHSNEKPSKTASVKSKAQKSEKNSVIDA